MRARRVGIIALLLAPVLVALAVRLDLREGGAEAPLFACDLVDLDGRAARQAQPFAQPLVVSFWASWCEPCREVRAALERAAARDGPRLRVIGVLYEDTALAARTALGEDARYGYFADPGGACAGRLGVRGVPDTFFVGTDGRLRARLTGAVGDEALAQALAELVAEPAPPSAPAR